MRALILLLLVGCTQVIEATTDPEDLAAGAEAYCAANPHLPCGHVYACEQPADNELGRVEVCVLGPWRDVPEVEAVYGPCEPTPRHVGLCWWCIGEGCTAGCNALTSCWDPEGAE